MLQAMEVEKLSGPLFPTQELAPVESPRWEGACHAVRATGKGRRVAWMAHTGPCVLSSSELYLEDLHPSAMSGCSKTFRGLSRTLGKALQWDSGDGSGRRVDESANTVN